MDIQKIKELYIKRLQSRKQNLMDFMDGKKNFIVVQRPAHAPVWKDCSSAEKIAKNNLELFAKSIELDWTDELPYLEPWAGVGVYAKSFGSEYYWRENESPATHYAFNSINEAGDIQYPDWRTNSVMQMILESIDRMNELSGGSLPISLTDTQSPLDTATLIIDSSQFLIDCYEEPDKAKKLLALITDLVIEFSREQFKHIGENNAARPGHIMSSSTLWGGISLSDDDLSFCSPDFNLEFSMPYNQKIGEAFGGVHIHSCGPWAHTMKVLNKSQAVTGIDCALTLSCDPGPNKIDEVRDAMKGKDIITKVRCGSAREEIINSIKNIFDPDIRLVMHIGYDEKNAESNYKEATELLSKLYNQ